MQIHAETALAAYRTGEVGSAEPIRIIILLYEGALRFSRQAQNKFDDAAIRGQALGRAHGIVSELMVSLDHEKGEAIAANLEGLYQYMLEGLTEANISNDKNVLKSVM